MKRTCGSCSLCCKIMEVDPQVKPDNDDWCKHAKPGCGGCGIYKSRPEVCREFNCMWLLNTDIKDYWYPLKSKIVITSKLGPPSLVGFIVDPAYPLRWREEPWFSDIKYIAQAGIEGRLDQKWQTIVMIRGEKIPIVGSERLIRGTPAPAPH